MKKVFLCIFLLLFILSGCSDKTFHNADNKETLSFSDGYVLNTTTTASYGILSCDNNADEEKSDAVLQDAAVQNATGESVINGEIRGVWLSYYEIDVDNSKNTREKYAAYIDSLCRNFSAYGITDAFVHVRPYADALYKSGVYPTSVYAGVSQGEEPPFDLLEVICEVMGSYGMRVHAWLNPYRVHNGSNINELSENNKARQWYKEDSNEDVAVVGGKIYFNPASEKARQLVIDGAREILLGYPVAGIHIDDYFYPPDCGDFDSVQYEAYLSAGGTLSRDDWRRDNVNKLVRGLYNTVKGFGADKIFSVSPAGNISNNYTGLYADVSLWCKGGYADMIIPQIYFGFVHESHGFEKCMSDWYSMKGPNVKMPVGLALYKAGTEDEFAGSGKTEWKQSSDIITRQVKHIRSCGGDGFVLFSTEFFLSQSGAAKNELDGLKDYLNN